MSLPSKARDFLRGLISSIAVNAREGNLITAPSAPWHSNGYASSTPAGRPTSLMMNLFMFKPLKNGIFPFPPIDGSPQTLEGFWRAHQVPITDVAKDPSHLKLLEEWMRSYNTEE